MPSFQQIYNQFNSAKTQNVIGPDESISDFARKALMLTGDPSYQSVAEGGPVGNFVRSRSADLTNFINQGPVDEWLGERTKQIGDWFGVSPEASRSVGESLPRMAVDFLPMAVGAALAPATGGGSLLPMLGLGATSGLSAASAYEQSGKLSDAAIGAAAPYIGSKLSEIGGRAALNFAARSPFMQRLGFTGGTAVTGEALNAVEQAGLVANRGLTQEVAAGATKSFTRLDKPMDKLLHYAGGEALANVGFTGLDIAQQGTDAVFNRDYLFANLISNVPFAAADLAGSFAHRQITPTEYNIPEVRPQYKSPSEERAVLAAATLYDLKSPEAVEKFRKQYGLDIADVSLKTQDLRDALTVKELGLRAVDANFVTEWNNFVTNDKLAQDAGLAPIERVGAFGSEFKGINDVVGQKDLPSKAQELVDKFKAQRSELFRTYASAVKKLGNPVDEVRSLKYAVEDLQLDEFLKAPVEQRDYAKALEKTFLSPDGVDLIRDIHRREAGLEPLRPDLYNEFVNLYKTGTANFTADKRVELAVAASLARGKVLKFDGAKKKAQEMVDEGQKDDVVVEEALKELEKQNVSSVFKQPVIPEQTLSGLTDLGAGSTLDIFKGLPMKLNRKQEFIPEGTQSGLSDLGNPVAGDGILQQVPRKTQEDQQVVKPLNERSAEELYVAITRGAMTKQRSLDARNVIAQDVAKLSEGKKKELGKFLSEQTGSDIKPRDLVDTLLEAWTFRDDPRLFDDAFDEDVKFQKKLEKKEFKGSVYISGEDREGFALAASPDGREHLIPLPEGPRQRVAEFARGLMAKLVPAEMLPEKTEELIQLSKLFNNPEVAYAELGKLVKDNGDIVTPENQGKIYGAASYKLGQVIVNSPEFKGQNPSDRLAFVFAHEQSHISFAKALDGKYGPQAKIQAEKALSWVTTADPQAKKAVEDVLVELHLGKDLAQMDGVRDVLNNSDPQEWLANAMGVYAMGVVKSRKPKQAFAMLPKPIREFAEWMVQGFQTLVKGAKAWMRLSGGNYQGAKAVKDLFDTVRKSYREAEWDAIQAQKFLDIEPSSMLDQMDDVLYARAKGGVPPMSDDPKAFLGDAFNKTVQPMHTLARTHKEFVEPVMAVLKSHSDTENTVAEVYKTVAGELSSSDKVLINNLSFARVMKSEQLSRLFDAIQVHSRVNNRRMIKLVDNQSNTIGLDMDALSPQLRGRVGQFNPEAQKALVTLLAQAERANGLTQRKALEADYQQSVHRLAMILTTKPSFGKGDFHKAPEIAEGVLKDLEVGDSQNAESKLAMLDEVDRAKVMQRAGELYQQYESLKKFYDEHPTFMSFRRYGWLKQKIVKGDKTDVIDADSEKELETIVKQYLDQGWQRKGGYIREVEKRKNPQYEINQGLLKVMQDNDAAFKEMIQNEAGLSDDQKEKILSTTSTTDAMLREINGRELYRPKVGTKFSGDLERFSWWEQFQKYTPAAIAAAQKRALGAKVNFWMQNPALESLSIQKDQFMELFEQSKDADPAWARKLNKLNAAWHIGWNLPGHIAELFQPMLAGVHELVSQGESLPGAMRMFHKAEKEVGKVQAFRLKEKFLKPKELNYTINKGKKDEEIFEGLPAVWLRANGETKENIDIARMLHEKRDRYQRAPMSEVRDFLGEDQVKLQRMMEGKPETALSDIVTRPFHTYVKAAMGFYSQFTMHNGVVSLVTGYRKGRKMGKSHEEAMKFAELFDLTSNNSSGRLERPAMFGKLGGAGHLVYGLSSYIRGRFSQLATYYRHGFDEKQFPELTGEQRKNARKAFQTMILAQVGAAGLLGLPFVGAGIALMEELLGEDIKGKMINALDEVTNDPMLTRVFTHGMGAALTESLGIPADMHSRFALSSFLGTNTYDGISAKSFMGPSVAMFSSMFNLAGRVMQGDKMEKALSVSGPGGVKRLVEALGEDFQRDNPEANLTMSMLGFRSSQMVKRKEWEQITRKQELEARRNLEKSALNISNALQVSPLEGRKALLVEADNLLPQEMGYQEQIKQRQQNVKDLIQKVSELEANRVGPQDVRRSMPGRIAPVASQTAQSMGVQMTDPMEVARALAQQQTRSQLGATVSQRPVRNALLQEMQWGQNPWSF